MNKNSKSTNEIINNIAIMKKKYGIISKKDNLNYELKKKSKKNKIDNEILIDWDKVKNM